MIGRTMKMANAALLQLCLAVATAQGTYTITDLGTRIPFAINTNGHVTGSQQSGCFIYDGNGFQYFSASGATSTTCVTINDSDLAAGSLLRGGVVRGFTYDTTHGLSEIGTLGGGYSRAYAVSNDGTVVGNSTIVGNPPNSDSLLRAFSFKNGKISNLSGLSTAYSQAVGINSSGQIAGNAQISGVFRGIVFDAGNITQIPMPSGFTGLGALGLSDSGHVIGLLSSTGVPRAFLFFSGTTALVPSIADGRFNEPHGVNKQGDVVGVGGTSNALRHAFIFSGGETTDLNTLIGANASADWVLEDATSINANGVIVGYGSFRGQPRGFLLTPGPPGPPLFDQTPVITTVVNGADFASGVTNGGFGTLFGLNLSNQEYRLSALPYPEKLGQTELRFCTGTGSQLTSWNQCVPMGLLYAGPQQVNFRVPFLTGIQQRQLGSFVIRRDGVESAPSRVTGFNDGLPRIFSMGFDCNYDSRVVDTTPCGLRSESLSPSNAERGAITDLAGNLVTSANPARLGEWYSIWFTGLGPLLPNGKPQFDVRLALDGIPGFPGETFFNVWLPEFVGESPQFPGLNQMNFKLSIPIGNPLFPTSTLYPCGSSGNKLDLQIQIVQAPNYGRSLAVGLFDLPILIRPGDAACR